MKDKLSYICDKERHLICLPYSIENLHLMATDLGIKVCWFHKKKKLSHYDIPVNMIKQVESKCDMVFKNKFELGRFLIKQIA